MFSLVLEIRFVLLRLAEFVVALILRIVILALLFFIAYNFVALIVNAVAEIAFGHSVPILPTAFPGVSATGLSVVNDFRK
jgi:hypothetical protein